MRMAIFEAVPPVSPPPSPICGDGVGGLDTPQPCSSWAKGEEGGGQMADAAETAVRMAQKRSLDRSAAAKKNHGGKWQMPINTSAVCRRKLPCQSRLADVASIAVLCVATLVKCRM